MVSQTDIPPVFSRVRKSAGDYVFEGQVRAVLHKRSGAVRLVVEDDRGLLLIMSPGQVTPVADPDVVAAAEGEDTADTSTAQDRWDAQ